MKSRLCRKSLSYPIPEKGVCEGLIKHVEYLAIQTPINVTFLIYCILTVQKKYIITCDGEIGATPSMLSLSHKLFVGKYVADIVVPIISPVDEIDMVFDKEMLYFSLTSGPMRSNILKGFDS